MSKDVRRTVALVLIFLLCTVPVVAGMYLLTRPAPSTIGRAHQQRQQIEDLRRREWALSEERREAEKAYADEWGREAYDTIPCRLPHSHKPPSGGKP